MGAVKSNVSPRKTQNNKTTAANNKENGRTEETFDIWRGVNDDESSAGFDASNSPETSARGVYNFIYSFKCVKVTPESCFYFCSNDRMENTAAMICSWWQMDFFPAAVCPLSVLLRGTTLILLGRGRGYPFTDSCFLSRRI